MCNCLLKLSNCIDVPGNLLFGEKNINEASVRNPKESSYVSCLLEYHCDEADAHQEITEVANFIKKNIVN